MIDFLSLEAPMKNCFQFKTMSILDHGLDVREYFCELKEFIVNNKSLTKNWKFPSWISNENIYKFFISYNDEIARYYQIYHDCGKPFCIIFDENGNKHFPNHAKISAQKWKEHAQNFKYCDEIANLIEHDMDAHTIRSNEYFTFISQKNCILLLLTALCEIHSNSNMFGDIDSDSFKIKFKKIDKLGKFVINNLNL